MSATGRPASNPAAGFTLIEMLVVLAISALIAGLAFPSVERLAARAELLAARSLVVAELSHARADALRFDEAVRVEIARDGTALGRGEGSAVILPSGIRLLAQPAVLGFYPDGSATGGQLRLEGERLSASLELDARDGGVRTGPLVSRKQQP
jgi:general secretion pathway protein H